MGIDVGYSNPFKIGINMGLGNPFRRDDENTRRAWGYTFQQTPDHLTPEQMQGLKYSYDTLGEECLNSLDEICPPVDSSLPRNVKVPGEKDTPKRDLYALLRDHASEDPKLNELWTEVNTVPDWVDWDQISRGQDVFYRYGGVSLTALCYQSLLGGMGANRVVETLARTGGFSTSVAKRRLFETTQHILQVTKSLESVQPGGAGHASSVRVRLLHAAVRRRIMKLESQRPGYFDVEKWGIPINDLDSVATIISFSAALIWLGMPRQGIFLRDQEIEDYIALWRLVAHYLGTPTEFFSSPAKAKRVMESIAYHEISPSETSKVLANNIISSLQDQAPAYPSRDFLCASARWLNGQELGDALGLDRPSPYYYALVAGQCIFFMALCYTYRTIPYLDRKKLKALRRIMYAVVVENKTWGLGEETNFEFQYVPDFHHTTEKGVPVKVDTVSGVERRNFRTLVVASTAVGLAGWVGIKITLAVMRSLFW